MEGTCVLTCLELVPGMLKTMGKIIVVVIIIPVPQCVSLHSEHKGRALFWKITF